MRDLCPNKGIQHPWVRNAVVKGQLGSLAWRYMPIIPATWEVEAGGLRIRDQGKGSNEAV
jgi:hypothetical protein